MCTLKRNRCWVVFVSGLLNKKNSISIHWQMTHSWSMSKRLLQTDSFNEKLKNEIFTSDGFCIERVLWVCVYIHVTWFQYADLVLKNISYYQCWKPLCCWIFLCKLWYFIYIIYTPSLLVLPFLFTFILHPHSICTNLKTMLNRSTVSLSSPTRT